MIEHVRNVLLVKTENGFHVIAIDMTVALHDIYSTQDVVSACTQGREIFF